jgi:hypothetical protein
VDLISEAYERGRRAKRDATATSILDTAATVGLGVGTVFWNLIFWRFIAPTTWVEMLLAVTFAAGYAIVLPMLLSLLAPSTPAGMALAETKHRTWGYAISVAATIFLCYHAFVVVRSWWASRPGMVETGQDLFLAIGTLIIFVVVPALSWVQTAPDRWVAEVVQAQQVKRLKAAQEANIMAARVQYARGLALLKRGLANATAAERAELAGTLIAMQRAENEAIGQIADQMRIITGVETGVPLLDDPHVEQQYHQLTTGLERLIAPINDVDYVDLPALQTPQPTAVDRRTDRAHPEPTANAAPLVRSTVAHQDAETADRERSDRERSAVRHGPPRSANAVPVSTAVDMAESREAYAAARGNLDGAWSRRDLQRVLSVEKTKAVDLINSWRSLGLVRDISNPAYHYTWTEEQP